MTSSRSNSRQPDPAQNTDEAFERGFRQHGSQKARVYSRVPCSEGTHFSANRELFHGTIKNVSQGGIYIQTKERFEVGQEVVVAGPFGENNQDVKRCGRIVRADSCGIAIQFVRRDRPQPRR